MIASSSAGPDVFRAELSDEAIRLTRLVHRLLPDDAEVAGLLALMLFVDARRAARTTEDGDLISLADQDRSRWDASRIAEAVGLLDDAVARGRVGEYQIQAAIAAVHDQAKRSEDTDWSQILTLYDHLMTVAPSPIVALNRAVAVAEVDGPHAALRLIDDLDLDRYYLFHAIRADLFRRLGRHSDAARAYDAAIERTENLAERAFLSARRAAIDEA